MVPCQRMNSGLTRALIKLTLPFSTIWVKHHEGRILRSGVPLSPEMVSIAKKLGVQFPGRVRVLSVAEVPPISFPLRFLARRVGLASNTTIGMALGYGILVRSDCWEDKSLVAHELVHTSQYERLGGVAPFLKTYLAECLITPGYPFGPLEQEAQDLAKTVTR
jgi:hypothetical protein